MIEGHFIVIEGIDGSGTTTQCSILADRLTEKGLDAVISFPPSVMLGNWNSTLEEELAFIDDYAESVIRPFGQIGP